VGSTRVQVTPLFVERNTPQIVPMSTVVLAALPAVTGSM
jgi:hypothetical protein